MRISLLLMIAALFTASAFAQQGSQSSDGDALIAKSRAVYDALKTKDVAGIKSLIADDFRIVSSERKLHERGELLGTAREGAVPTDVDEVPRAARGCELVRRSAAQPARAAVCGYRAVTDCDSQEDRPVVCAFDQVRPPSNEMVAPPSFPLIIRFGSCGSIHMMCVSPCGTRISVKVCPPSIERFTPRFMTYTVFSSVGSAVTAE